MSAAAGVRITDGALNALVADITRCPPERGGVLLGNGQSLVTLYLADDHGEYTSASWDISAEAGRAVAALERAGTGVLTGSVHSHPAGTPDPSSPDIAATARLLEANPHLRQVVVLIVTIGNARPDDLPLTLKSGLAARLSAHVMRRDFIGMTWQRAIIDVVPLHQDLATAHVRVRADTGTNEVLEHDKRQRHQSPSTLGDLPMLVAHRGSTRIAVPIRASEATRPRARRGRSRGTNPPVVGLLLVHDEYPEVGPLCLGVQDAEADRPGDLVPLSSSWDATEAAPRQLETLVRGLRRQGIDHASDRIKPIVGNLRQKRVLIFGAGSVGSLVADQLVRSGVGQIGVVDGDTVSEQNLSRTVYRATHVGRPKPVALASHLRDIDPAADVRPYSSMIGELRPSQLDDMISDADLVVLATDDMHEQGQVAHRLYAHSLPHVACALYRAAAAGEVITVIPELGTPCWSCCIGGVRGDERRGNSNYGVSTRLVSEAALGPAISVVVSYAAITALGLLVGPAKPLGAPIAQRVKQGRSLGVITTVPGWDFLSQIDVLGLPHQSAPQSVWMQVERDSECVVCGSERISPPTDLVNDQIDGLFQAISTSCPSIGGDLRTSTSKSLTPSHGFDRPSFDTTTKEHGNGQEATAAIVEGQQGPQTEA